MPEGPTIVILKEEVDRFTGKKLFLWQETVKLISPA